MGRIEDVVVAKDGQVRQASVRTSSGLIRRPAHELAALDVEVKSTELQVGMSTTQSKINYFNKHGT